MLSSGLARSRKQAPKKPVQAAHCRPLWTVAREVRHLPLEIEAEAQASWPLARVGSSAKSREGSNAHAASGFRLRLDTTNQDAVLQWAQFHRWSPRTRIYEGVRIIGRSADSRASRAVAWDSSLSANASKVLSTRALLPIAPRRHSDASTLSNSGEYILSTGPLLRLG